MLERSLRSALLVACVLNVFYAASIPFHTSGPFPVAGNSPVLIGGMLSVAVGIALTVLLLRTRGVAARDWIKATLVFLVLSPVAAALLNWPNLSDATCIGRGCYGEAILPTRLYAMANVWQTHFTMLIVAIGALFCATRVAAATPALQR